MNTVNNNEPRAAEMTFEELKKAVAEIEGLAPVVAGLVVAPDVFAAMQRQIPITEDSTSGLGPIKVYVNKSLPRGAVVPIDKDGKPIPKPETS